MPEVHFLGEVSSCKVEASSVSVSWAIVPGNYSWFLREGLSFGETQTHSNSWVHTCPVGYVCDPSPVLTWSPIACQEMHPQPPD